MSINRKGGKINEAKTDVRWGDIAPPPPFLRQISGVVSEISIYKPTYDVFTTAAAFLICITGITYIMLVLA